MRVIGWMKHGGKPKQVICIYCGTAGIPSKLCAIPLSAIGTRFPPMCGACIAGHLLKEKCEEKLKGGKS